MLFIYCIQKLYKKKKNRCQEDRREIKDMRIPIRQIFLRKLKLTENTLPAKNNNCRFTNFLDN